MRKLAFEMNFQLYVIKGKENSGKTTTCWKILNLFRSRSLIDCFCYWKTSNSSELRYEDSDQTYRVGKTHADFTTIFTIKHNNKRKKVAIISAGDDANWLQKRIFEMLGEGVDSIVCCERAVNRGGSTQKMLHTIFNEYIIYEEDMNNVRDSFCSDRIAEDVIKLIINRNC